MILNAQTALKKMRRMALQVVENNYAQPHIIIIGIQENGLHIANKVAGFLTPYFTGKVEVVGLAIDKKKPASIRLSKEVDITGKMILLVDDVANSGRTMLYALQPLLLQWPLKIETLALVERTYKQFPIQVNYTGLSVSTLPEQTIVVKVENGEVMGAEVE